MQQTAVAMSMSETRPTDECPHHPPRTDTGFRFITPSSIREYLVCCDMGTATEKYNLGESGGQDVDTEWYSSGGRNEYKQRLPLKCGEPSK